MSFTINGHIINFENYYSVSSDNIYKVEYSGGFKYAIVVNEPGEYEGVTFDEVGVYAFNFGKYGLNYEICLGKKYSPDFKSTLKYGKYIYNDDYYFTFEESEYGYSYSAGGESGSSLFGRTIYIDGKFGIVSRDGTYIKLYKYLSNNWSFDEDIVILTYQDK